MGAYPTPRFVPAGGNSTVPNPSIDVEKWTEQTTQSLNSLSITSPSGVRGTSVSLAIDLDEQKEAKPAGAGAATPSPYRPKRKLLRRDSLDRREALLRGKEGSRRRTRWENDRLLNNPWAQPPLPSDWEVHPTHPRHTVPYYLAPLWDQEIAARVEAQQLAKRKSKAKRAVGDSTGVGGAHGGHENPVEGRVPREVRQRFKKSKANRGLLHMLEEQVRLFVAEGNRVAMQQQAPAAESRPASSSSAALSLSDDEEIVFVGRNGRMRDVPPSPKYHDAVDSDADSDSEKLVVVHRPHSRTHAYHQVVDVSIPVRQKLVLESPVGDRSAGFGRWLVHVIAAYYGLRTWSRTIGDPARREAYIGLPHKREGEGGLEIQRAGGMDLPRPLYCLV